MKFRTPVHIPVADFQIHPAERMLFVGSCFAERIGSRFTDACFPTQVNPFGTMYNPASILHTVERVTDSFDTVVITLGTNHVYIEKSSGEIVDNCRKRPQALFVEQTLSVGECVAYLNKAIDLLRQNNPRVRIIFTVSPIRYAKYGFHGSQLSKAALLLAVDEIVGSQESSSLVYFPAYEIVLDELRDYRFYANDMLHPSEQAVDYIWERFSDAFFGTETKQYLDEWQSVNKALSHRPFHADTEEYQAFMQKTLERAKVFAEKYHVKVPVLSSNSC